MSNKYFVNEFVTKGMLDYFNCENKSSFEYHIIECLVFIYSASKLKTLFDNKDSIGFETLIKMYGLKPNIYDSFLRDTSKYEKEKKEFEKGSVIKSDTVSIIEVSIIAMYVQKSFVSEPLESEIKDFENLLLNSKVSGAIKETYLNPNRTKEYWDKKKKMLSSKIKLVEIKPDFLDANIYLKYGVSLSDVKKMDYRMVKELNNYIVAKENSKKDTINKKRKKHKINVVITSGNRYVDALMMMAITATEMSIGLIYLFMHL